MGVGLRACGAAAATAGRCRGRVPLSSVLGKHKTVKARFGS